MSKIYDVEKMYGQDFNMVTTNAPSNIIKQAKKLLPNTFLICSPQDENGGDSDNNMPSMFVTDYNAQPLQLTYPFYTKNGLNYHDNGYLYINIDNSTIKTENLDGSGKLKVETNNLSYATFNKKGVVQLSEKSIDINRNLSKNYNLQQSISNKYDNNTFITVNNDGILYLNNDLLDLINNLVDLKIKRKIDSIKIMLNSNLKMWIEIIAINGLSYSNNIHNVGSLTDIVSINDDRTTSLVFNLHYLSFNYESENVEIIDSSNKIYSIEFENNNKQTIVEALPNNDELYQHTLNNISVIFLPNYFIENNENYNQEIPLIFEIDNDRSESISFKQNKLSEYNIEITVNSEDIPINEILNTSTQNGIFENINLSGFKKIYDGENQIIKYQIYAYIVNNSDESDNYELLVIDDYDITDNGINIYNYTISNENQIKSKLYTFINNIIGEEDNDDNSSDEYEINIEQSIQNNDKYFLISDFIERRIEDGKIKYYINLGTNFKIITDKNKEIGNYYKKIPIPLNIDRKTIYGYIFIINSDILNNYNNNSYPKHIYYRNRNQSGNNQRLYLNQVENYDPKNIDTTKLYCIYSDNDISQGLYIPYNTFKTYDTKKNDSTSIKDIGELISSDDNNIDFKSNNNQIKISFTTNISNNILNMLYEGYLFNIKYGQQNQSNDKSIIKSQDVELKFNMLELLLTNMQFGFISHDNNKDIWNLKFNILPEHILNTNNYNSFNYYSMDNYVITGFNNNQIKSIKLSLPKCIRDLLLSNFNTNLFMNLYFYKNSNEGCLQKETIKFVNTENDGIQGTSFSNMFEINNNFDIETGGEHNTNNYIITFISTSTSTYFPKLLMIGYSITHLTNTKEEKKCYVQNTYSCNGGSIIQSLGENTISSQKLIEVGNENDKLYDIIFVVNNDNNQEIIKSILHEKSNNSSENIEIDDLYLTDDLKLKFHNSTDNPNQDQSFNLLINNGEEYFNAELGQRYTAKFQYNYLLNINNSLNNYNNYSLTPINGGKQITLSGYQIRFNKVLFKLKNPNSNSNIFISERVDSDLIIIYYIGNSNSDNTLNNFRNSILKNIFDFTINGETYNSIFNRINVGNINMESEPINNSDEHNLIFSNWALNGTNWNNILLGKIKYYHLYWEGLKYNNTNITNISLNASEPNNYENILYNLSRDNLNNQVISNGNNYDLYFSMDSNNYLSLEDVLRYINGQLNNFSNEETLTYDVFAKINDSYIQIVNKQVEFYLSNIQYSDLSDGDLQFIDENNNPSNNIQITSNNSNDDILTIKYYKDKISSIGLIIDKSDQPDNWFIRQQSENEDTEFKYITYRLKSGYINHSQHIIKCKAIGQTGNINYAKKTYICTVNININVPEDPNLSWLPDGVSINGVFISSNGDENPSYPTLSNINNVEVTYNSSNTTVANINSITGEIHIEGVGTTTISAIFKGNENYLAKTVKYELTITDSN